MKINLQNVAKAPHTPTKTQFQQWIKAALLMTPTHPSSIQSELTLRLINETESAELNERFRNKKGPTNILSFPDSDIPGVPSTSLGDIVICSTLVKDEAQWAHLTIH